MADREAAPPPPPPPKRASLLGIPVELRLEIYDYVRYFLPQHSITSNVHADHRTAPFGYNYGRYISRCNLRRPEIAWLNLLYTCSAIYRELKGHLLNDIARCYRKSSDIEEDPPALQTYEMQITANGIVCDFGHNRKNCTADAVWTSIPCPPSQCRALQASILLSSRVAFAGDGGPTEILRDLYQTLNRVLHYGPMMDSQKPLRHPLSLTAVNVIVATRQAGTDLALVSSLDAEHDGPRAIAGFADQLQETGLLDKLVKRVMVYEDDGSGGIEVVGKTVVKPRNWVAKIPDLWRGAAFEWGVPEP